VPEQPLTIESRTGVLDELEKLAEGFERRNFHFVSLCLTKIVREVAPPEALQTETTLAEEAVSTGGLAELHKTVKALDTKDFHLAAVCFRKALAAYNAAPPTLQGVTISNQPALNATLSDVSKSLTEGDFTSLAAHVRHIAALLIVEVGQPRPLITETAAAEVESLQTTVDAEPSFVVPVVAAVFVEEETPVQQLSQEARMQALHERLEKLEAAWEATHADLQTTTSPLSSDPLTP
jgi:hypothetical protein